MADRLTGKRCLITGAASGLGAAVARRYAREGAEVFLADRDPNVYEVAAVLLGEGHTAHAHHADLTDPQGLAGLVSWFGSHRFGLDVLVNNAGVSIGGAAHEVTDADWDREMAVNLTLAQRMTHRFWPHLSSAGSSVINTASIASNRALAGCAAYCVAKAGILMLTKCTAVDGAADGVRANCVSPGYVDTPMLRGDLGLQPDPDGAERYLTEHIPLGRLGAPDDLVGAYVHLASDDSQWMSGQQIVVDGGQTAGTFGL